MAFPRQSPGPVRGIAWLCLAIVPSAAVGCAEEASINARNFAEATSAASPPGNLATLGPARGEGAGPGEPATEKTPSPAAPRKIIYDAKIDLTVESLGGVEAALLDLVHEHSGFLAESNLSTQAGSPRAATWRVRVPVDHFDAFVRAVGRLGEVRTSHVGSQDVTAEYVDVEARIRNKQEEEKRLLKHLADSTGKLEDILKVEGELSRVRGEVEQMQGRLRYLANRADLGTVTVIAAERQPEPRIEAPPEPPSLAERIRGTFHRSLDVLIALGEALLLFAVALAPWLPLIALGVYAAYAMHRAALRSEARRMHGHTPDGAEEF